LTRGNFARNSLLSVLAFEKANGGMAEMQQTSVSVGSIDASALWTEEPSGTATVGGKLGLLGLTAFTGLGSRRCSGNLAPNRGETFESSRK